MQPDQTSARSKLRSGAALLAANEHDACGVGFVVNIKRQPQPRTDRHALADLRT